MRWFCIRRGKVTHQLSDNSHRGAFAHARQPSMADNQQMVLSVGGIRPSPLVRGPLSLEELGVLIRKGTIRSDTLVRFGLDTRWYAASNFLLLKQFLEPTPSYTGSPSRRLPLIGLAALILFLTTIYFFPGRDAVPRHYVLPLPERAMVSPAQGSRLSVAGIIQCTNRARAENGGLPPLSENSLLDAIASERAADMIQKQYFAHLFTIRRGGYRRSAAGRLPLQAPGREHSPGLLSD